MRRRTIQVIVTVRMLFHLNIVDTQSNKVFELYWTFRTQVHLWSKVADRPSTFCRLNRRHLVIAFIAQSVAVVRS